MTVLFFSCVTVGKLSPDPVLSTQGETVQTMPEESRAQGTIGVRMYVKYLTAGANVLVLLTVILINILAQVCREGGQ